MEPALDLEVVKAIKEIGSYRGSGSLFQELYQMFDQQASLTLAGLEAAVEAMDYAKVRQLAHRLKGSAGSLGAAGLAQACHTLEQVGKEASCGAETLQAGLTEVSDALRRALGLLAQQID